MNACLDDGPREDRCHPTNSDKQRSEYAHNRQVGSSYIQYNIWRSSKLKIDKLNVRRTSGWLGWFPDPTIQALLIANPRFKPCCESASASDSLASVHRGESL